MNVWIDCMTYFDDGMTRFSLESGRIFHLEIAGAKDFSQRLPEIFQVFIECSAVVNSRRLEQGEPPILALVLL